MSDINEFYPCSMLPSGFEGGGSLFIVVAQTKLLCIKGSQTFLLERWQFSGVAACQQYLLGVYDGRPCYAVELIPTEQAPDGSEWVELRALLDLVSDVNFNLAGRAVQVVQWEREHQYCGCCGRPTAVNVEDRSRICNNCDKAFYPRISPCVIVVITKGRYCLLASNAKWGGRYYSALAGFVEPGETVESALHREVMEEVGIEVDNLKYFGSQPWPFPGQLMLGFHATYKAGDIQVDNNEIIAADWWHYDDLPACPGPNTLSGQLIRTFVSQCKNGHH